MKTNSSWIDGSHSKARCLRSHIRLRCTVSFFLALLSSHLTPVLAQGSGSVAFSKQEVVKMLDRHTPQATMKRLVLQRHIDFEVTEEVKSDLKNNHGASDELINVLKDSQPQQQPQQPKSPSLEEKTSPQPPRSELLKRGVKVGHPQRALAVSLSPDHPTREVNSFRLMNIARFKLPWALYAPTFSSDGDSFAIRDLYNVFIWNVRTRKLLTQFAGYASAPVMVFSRDGTELIVSDYDKINVHDAITGRILSQMNVSTHFLENEKEKKKYPNEIHSLDVNGPEIAIGYNLGGLGGCTDRLTYPNTANLWNFKSGAVQNIDVQNEGSRSYCVRTIRFSPDGARMAIGGRYSDAWLTQTSNSDAQTMLGTCYTKSNSQYNPDKLVFSSDGSLLAVGGTTVFRYKDTEEGAVGIYDAKTGKSFGCIKSALGWISFGFSEDNSYIAVSGSASVTESTTIIEIVDTHTLKTIASFPFDKCKVAVAGTARGILISTWNEVPYSHSIVDIWQLQLPSR